MIIFSSFSPRFSTISLFTIVTGKVPIYPVERRTSDFLWYLRRSGSVDDVTTTRNVVGLPGILFPLDISGIRRYIQSFPSLFRPWHVSSSTFRKLEFRPVPSSSSASTSVSFFSCFAWFHIVAEVRPIANRWIGTFALIISPGRDALGNGEPRKPRGGNWVAINGGIWDTCSCIESVFRVQGIYRKIRWKMSKCRISSTLKFNDLTKRKSYGKFHKVIARGNLLSSGSIVVKQIFQCFWKNVWI